MIISCDSQYKILFEPIKIGPVTAKNRFFQVPHCNGMGHAMPEAHAAMREVKAEGGWAVVCTEECEIHPSSDVSPYVEARLWDDQDIPALQLMCDKVHAHGALAGIELTHNGPMASNLYSREILLAPSHQPGRYPMQARAMSKNDIKQYRHWHRMAAVRAKKAGFDIIYVYAAHDLSLPMHFLQKRRNTRSDEYGGSLENRVRLLREIIEDTKDAVGDTCAVAVRFATEEMLGSAGVHLSESKEIVHMLADIPDLWDVNIASWYNDSTPSRFAKEGYQEPFIDWVKKVTTKPVVGVGRFTNPDSMVSQIKRGILDFIGAARPSIADPFLPKKIAEGRFDDIRECIGCNICVSGDNTVTPIRCTQNPTMGEEWRKDWHPEKIPAKKSNAKILIVGGGPTGLEAARTLGERGYEVHLAEAEREFGGRVTKESRLFGLSEWGRVKDWRLTQIKKNKNIHTYLESRLSVENIFEFGADHVLVATGCYWRNDGYGRTNGFGIDDFKTIEKNSSCLLTPDNIMDGIAPQGPVVIFDDDYFYHGSVIAEELASKGCTVYLVTPDDTVASWTNNTLEYKHIQKRLYKLGVKQIVSHNIKAFQNNVVTLENIWSEDITNITCSAVVTITARLPYDELYQSLLLEKLRWTQYGIQSVQCAGDALAPGLIAHAVYAGHRYARELDETISPDTVPFKRRPILL